jgi:hypothetical protein
MVAWLGTVGPCEVVGACDFDVVLGAGERAYASPNPETTNVKNGSNEPT